MAYPECLTETRERRGTVERSMQASIASPPAGGDELTQPHSASLERE